VSTSQLDDGATVYSGTAAAGLIARESGFKEGRSIRLLPFGYWLMTRQPTPPLPSTRR